MTERNLLLRVTHRVRRAVKQFWLNRRVGVRWQHDERGFLRRSYASYQDYLLHQRSKLELYDLAEYNARFRAALRERLLASSRLPKNATVLCLGARLGGEVQAFIDAGCFAVGIDLNPGTSNRFVLPGDFHELQFADGSVDVVFTNALDHVFEPEKVIAEVRRVLRTGGHFMVEAVKGTAYDRNPRFFESFWWTTCDDLIALFATRGFALAAREPITIPWEGEQLLLRKTS